MEPMTHRWRRTITAESATPRDSALLPVLVAVVAAMTAAMRAQYGPGVTICLIAGVVLAPMWVTNLKRFRRARSLLLVGAGAVAWGAVLTQLDAGRSSSTSLLIAQTLMMLSFLCSIGMLLWARSLIGTGATIVAFGVGGLVNIVLTGGNPANLWKYSLAIPVALILLGIAAMRNSRILELIALVTVAGVSAISDSRSMTAFLLLTAVLVLWQMTSGGTGRLRPRPWQTILGLAALGLSVFLLFQALILDGVLGEAAAERTQAQIDTSGSLLAGGRPEMGAAVGLISAQPWGYGSGTVPTSNDVWLAKTGMSALNYDPNNGYVERYMFGGQFEVHSVLGDLWIRYGPLGAVFALAICVLAVYATARHVSLRTASAALIFLTALGVWDAFFSPLLTSYTTLALMAALALAPSTARSRRGSRSPSAS